MELKPYEIEYLKSDPVALRSLADHHEILLTMAEASDMGECVVTHQARKDELLAEADRIESDYDSCAA